MRALARFFGERTATGFVAFGIGDVVVGAPTGGQLRCRVEVYPAPDQDELDYVHALAHELRHVWQFVNNVPATEEDCENYACDFMRRNKQPYCGEYEGLVDDSDYASRRSQTLGTMRTLGVYTLALILACTAAPFFSYAPIGKFGEMSSVQARIYGIFLVLPLVVLIPTHAYLAIRRSVANQTHPIVDPSKASYAIRLQNHPDNGRAGVWVVGDFEIRASNAQEAITKAFAAGVVSGTPPMPRFKG
jgi:hypothetical protein